MSTSTQPRTADLPEVKAPIGVTTRSRSGKPGDRKRPGIPRGCRTATWQKTGTRSSRDPVEFLSRLQRPATRREDRSRERIGVRTNASLPTAFPARIRSECAIQPRRRRLRTRRTYGFPGPSHTSSPRVTATSEEVSLLQIGAANHAIPDQRAHLARLVEEQTS